MDDQAKIIETLQCIEALFAGAKTEGEREAAANARERMRARLESFREIDPPVEYKFTLTDMWSRKLFAALLRRYGLTPFRYYRQRYTTVMVMVSRTFVDETLWPEFQKLDETLREYLNDVTDRIISQGIYSDNSEPEIRQRMLTGADGES